MWNEYMEWVEDTDRDVDGQVTIYDEEEYHELFEKDDDEDEEDDHHDNKIAMYGVAAAAVGIGFVGHVLGTHVIAPAITKIQEKKDAKTRSHETSEWVRANIKNKKQKTTEPLQGNDNSRKNSRRETNS